MYHLLRQDQPPTPEQVSEAMERFLQELESAYALKPFQVRRYARAAQVAIDHFQKGTRHA